MIETVRGPIRKEEFGKALTHEHVLMDFAPALESKADRYDPEEVFNLVLPHLERLRQAGGQSLVESTPASMARDPALLRRLSEATGLHLLTSTGLYREPHLPPYAFEESEESIAARWEAEAAEGIDGTAVRPGFIQTAVDGERPLRPIEQKLLRAAALVHRVTGLPIATHCPSGPSAREVLKLLSSEGITASAWIWSHAEEELDSRYHFEAARQGAWIEFADVGRKPFDQLLQRLHAMLERDLANSVLLSQNAGWYHVGEEAGGSFLGYDILYQRFVPMLRRSGMEPEAILQILVGNPAAAFDRRET